MVAVTLAAVLGPLLVKVTVAVMLAPGVPAGVTLSVVERSATGVSAVAALTVLLAVVVSAVVVATPAVQFCVVLEPSGTV
jgi:hypothetical protein